MNDLSHIPPPEERIPHGRRVLIIAATMLALFLGALDALVMSAAMPTVVSELGGLSLFSWVYSSYLLARAVSLPIFGKLADRLPTRALYQAAIGLYTAGSLAAGFATLTTRPSTCRSGIRSSRTRRPRLARRLGRASPSWTDAFRLARRRLRRGWHPSPTAEAEPEPHRRPCGL